MCSSITEKIVKSRVFWTEHQLLNQNQFGYLKGKSTLAQMLRCYNDWCTSRNSCIATYVIVLDFSKAFDRVPHVRTFTSKIEQTWY